VAIEREEIDRRLEQFKSVAKLADIKLTHQRLVIFRAVVSSENHPSAEAVYKAVRAEIPTVSLDTVYRTLWLLMDLGLLTTLGPRRDSVRFDANLKQHHHFLCMRCGLVRDFESSEFNELPIQDSVNRFGDIVCAQVEVQGVCDSCAKKADDAETASDSRTEDRDRSK